jgi:hypothetical protein
MRITPGPPRVRVGNFISTLRYWSWRGRRPFTDFLDRPNEDQRCLHPEFVDRWLLKVQDRLWR